LGHAICYKQNQLKKPAKVMGHHLAAGIFKKNNTETGRPGETLPKDEKNSKKR
jgi:hypothetical protein